MAENNDLQDLKKKLQLKRRQKEEPVPEAQPEEAPGMFDEAATAPEPESEFQLPFGEALSEDDAAKALSEHSSWLHRVPKRGKNGLLTLLVTVLVLAALGTGLIFGKVFKAREQENIRIDEALQVKAYMEGKKVADGSAKIFDAVEDFSAEVVAFVKEIEKARESGKTPIQMKDRIVAFLATCDAYAKNNVYFPVTKVFPTNTFNAEVLSVGMPVVMKTQVLYDNVVALARLHEKIATLSLPKSELNVSVLVEHANETFTPKVPKIAPKEGEKAPVAVEAESVEVSRPRFTVVTAGGIEENPMWAAASPRQRKQMQRWLIAYRGSGDDKAHAARTDQIGTLDVSFIVKKKDEAFVSQLLGESVGMIFQLKHKAKAVNFKKLREMFKRYEQREKYFTL